MARIAKVPPEAITSLYKKANGRITIEKGRIYVKNWHRYQEDYRDKSSSPETRGDTIKTINGPTPQYSTPQDSTQELATRKSAQSEKELTEKSFLLRPDEKEFAIWNARIKSKVAKRGSFTWKPTTGSFESDMKSLAYKFPDEKKRSLLWESYNMLQILNWLDYVELAITLMLNASERKPIHQPYNFVYAILGKPGALLSEQERGGLSGTLTEIVGERGRPFERI